MTTAPANDQNGGAGDDGGNPPSEAQLRAELAKLTEEHRDLDDAIAALGSAGGDQIRLQRLKKRKLWLKDRIVYLQDQLTPDIIA